MTEKTLSLIKPDAVKRSLIGTINSIFETNGLKIVAQKMITLTRKQSEIFYMEHNEKEFFEGLVEFMISGPIVAQVLEGEEAIHKNRELMGKTNFEQAAEGTIRKLYATSIRENCVHGSDSFASVQREISFFFSDMEIYSHYFTFK
jgi:nucleoside-diphosphate kinase